MKLLNLIPAGIIALVSYLPSVESHTFSSVKKCGDAMKNYSCVKVNHEWTHKTCAIGRAMDGQMVSHRLDPNTEKDTTTDC
tara:strand:- start:239 stop:481 length:243 start_codon:yes stop_codon:yes gene_type:complete